MKVNKKTDAHWTTLTYEQQVNIKTSLLQLDLGKGIPIKKAMDWLTQKYGLTKRLNKI